MDITPELLTAAAYGLILLLVAVGQYLNRPKQQALKSDPVLTGVGMAFGEHDQMERLIVQTKRIADSMDILADKRTDELEDIHRALLARLDMQERREEQEEPRRRPDPPRRR